MKSAEGVRDARGSVENVERNDNIEAGRVEVLLLNWNGKVERHWGHGGPRRLSGRFLSQRDGDVGADVVDVADFIESGVEHCLTEKRSETASAGSNFENANDALASVYSAFDEVNERADGFVEDGADEGGMLVDLAHDVVAEQELDSSGRGDHDVYRCTVRGVATRVISSKYTFLSTTNTLSQLEKATVFLPQSRRNIHGGGSG